MKNRRKKSGSIHGKLLIPVFVQIASLIVFVLVIIFVLQTSRRNLTETARVSELSAKLQDAKEAADKQYYSIIPIGKNERLFNDRMDTILQELDGSLGISGGITALKKQFNEMGELKRRNLEIENGIMKLSRLSIAQSNGYIEQVVAKLTDPELEDSVSLLERQVIAGANVNTSSNLAIQKLFYKMAYDPGAKSELLRFMDQALQNVAQDVERLSDTPFSQMPVEAQKSNLQIKELVEEYAANVGEINTIRHEMEGNINAVTSKLRNRETGLQEDTFEAIGTSFLLIGIFIAASSIIIAFLNIFLGLRISRSICRMAGVLKNISEEEGDLTKRLETASRDEIGDTARYFNATIDKISGLVVSIKTEAAVLEGIGNDLSSSMEETAAAVNQITAHISGVKDQTVNQSAGVTEAHATIEEISKNIETLNGHIETQSTSVVESSTAIEEMVTNINSVSNILVKNAEASGELVSASESGREGMDEVARHIQEIARESEGLIEASSIIENIANQTNLLAMNAAIEAAHAGEAGKGFAVVADEIRKLAENSGTQAKSISNVLNTLKGSIDQMLESTNSALKQFETIVSLTNTVNDQETIIKNAMDEQSTGSTQILEAIRQITDITDQVKDGSVQMLSGSREVLEEMNRLSNITQEITNSMNEMSVGTEEINTAVNHVNDISRQNEESINTLSVEISKFKVEE
jgi:methyl-accepting chemotaxis protein